MVDYFKRDYPNLSSELVKVSTLMKKNITLKNKEVKDAIFDIFDAGGKMLRPAYLLLFSKFTKLTNKQTLVLAAAVEMLHTATLVHDDIIDRADKRRGASTISSKYGADVAVYAGDYLFVTVFRLLSKHSLDLENLSKQISSIQKLLDGELGQMSKRFDLTQDLDDYIDNISGKTGELFALAMSLAPLMDGQLRLARTAYDIGLNVGIAFQVMDDYLDYTADMATLGKPVLEDIGEGIYTAPVLFALKAEPKVAREIITKKAYGKMFALVHESGALEETKKLAALYTNKALTLIKKLPKDERSHTITEITSRLLERVL